MNGDFTDLVDLVSEKVGGAALAANDEFFAAKENLIKVRPAEWREHEYTDRGKWMDGWETRRRREPGHDWCILRLGLPGVIRGLVVDTAFFRGNFPESCSIDACAVRGALDAATLLDPMIPWVTIVPRSPLAGDSVNKFTVSADRRFTHLRLNIYPDGGVARLRAYGLAVPDWSRLTRGGGLVDIAAAEHGGLVVACSDMFFGSRHNLILPGPPAGMHDGWETRRRRGPGHDWCIVKLAALGKIERVEVDTSHFKGNAPGSCAIDVCDAATPAFEALSSNVMGWHPLLPDTPLLPHTRHFFEEELDGAPPATFARLRIFPDGGVARLRLWAALTDPADLPAALRSLNDAGPDEAAAALRACCGASRWVTQMAEARPFASIEAVLQAADWIWWSLDEADWMEAFAAHPKIGERKAGEGYAQAMKEQAGTATADAATLAALATTNLAYESRFGFTYIVCATGKSAAEMLDILRRRLEHERDTEVRTAAEEQRDITRLRLEKWLRPEEAP